MTISAFLFLIPVSFAHDTPFQLPQKPAVIKLQILPYIFSPPKICGVCDPIGAVRPVDVFEGSSSHGGSIEPGASPEVTYDALVRIAFGLSPSKKPLKTKKEKLAKKKKTAKMANTSRRKKRLKKYLSLMRGVYR